MTNESIAAQACAADLAKVRRARAMTEQQRILAGPRLFAGACDRIREGLKDENPNASPETLHELLRHRLSIVLKPRLDWAYIEEWCEKHQTLDLLAEAKAEAAYAWEDA